MIVGEVRTFPHVRPDKGQVLKVLEEAAEVHAAWERWDMAARRGRGGAAEHLLAECADVIQATCNLAAALGVADMGPYMAECEVRNEIRGRYE